MEITLEKIELVKDRTGVSYKEAKEALEAAGGSVVDAIIAIEESIGEKTKSKIGEGGYKIIEKIKELIKKGNVSKIVIKKDGEIVLNLPVNIGIVGTVIAPFAMILGVLAAFGTKCVIEIVKDDGSIIDVSEMATETFDDVKEKGSVFADELKSRGADVYSSVVNKTTDALNRVKPDSSEKDDFSFNENNSGNKDDKSDN
jgi:hypothetical protein